MWKWTSEPEVLYFFNKFMKWVKIQGKKRIPQMKYDV